MVSKIKDVSHAFKVCSYRFKSYLQEVDVSYEKASGSNTMQAEEIAAQLADDVKKIYQYQYGRWFYRHMNKWQTATAPRLIIWQAMVARKRAGVVPSTALADEIQRCLELRFEKRYTPISA